ncbi:MAG: DUF5320 domain-containing protein [Smithellaceae bacterium]|nr:DUF5320 domain-containing protein [Smithellaceae bacterium]MDD3260164.1 DUF5320 domain-containing protein [Smithellaceae bacterium]
MPGGDATGPMGMGPMTGRAAGFCAGYSVPGYVNNGPGRAFGMGFGRGAGFRRGFHAGGFGRRNRFYAGGAPAAAPDPENEKQALKNQAEYLQMQLDAVKKRLKELSAQS